MPMVHEPLRYAHEEGHTDVCFTEDGDKFISCGADGDIRIWSTGESEDIIQNCVGEWALAVRQKGENVYVSTCRNDVQILSLSDGERNGVLDRFVAPINHIAVAKDKQVIALAGENMEVKVINLENNDKEVTVFDGLTGPCLSVALCPKSKFLAASSGDGKLRVWNVETKDLIKDFDFFPKVNSFANAEILCRLDFEPISGEQLAYPSEKSVIILNVNDWSTVNTFESDEIEDAISIVQFSPCGKFILATSLQGNFVIWEVSSGTVLEASKHEKGVAICAAMWNPNGNGEIVYTDKEGQLGIVTTTLQNTTDFDSKMGSEGMEVDKLVDFDDNDAINLVDQDDDDDENVVSVEKLKRQYMESPDLELKDLDENSSQGPTPRPHTPETPLQEPFMPSSTPEHLDPRYLCWNDVGIVKSYGNNADESDQKSIEVEFHDATFHSNVMITNYQSYSMGSLSKAALVVANASQVYVIPLSVTGKEWMLKVEEYDPIVLVAASENLVCFATSNYMIRICSIFGHQRAVVSVPGPLVSMVAFKDLLMVAYHAAGTRKGDQCINLRLIKFQGYLVESNDLGSAIGPSGTLSWIGFSDVGTPAMMDSLGILSMYPQKSNCWIPFCDTTKHRKSPCDGFFVTTVFESYQAVGGIKCKGSVYPGFVPRPTMCELCLEPPFAESTTEKTQMEMNLFTWSSLQVPNMDKKYKETSLKLFALAAKNNLDQRAFEIMQILSNPQILTLGLKYASSLDKKKLVEKLMDLATKIADESDDLGVNGLATPEPAQIKPFIPKLSLSGSKYTPRSRLTQKNKQVSTSTQNSITSKSQALPETPLTNITTNNDENINTQESLFASEEEPVNPFLKSLKKNTGENKETNPLSLTNKFSGVNYDTEVNNKKTETSAKRKLLDAETNKQKEKQRKLESFKFAKLT